MPRHLLHHLKGNMVGYIALFVALAGTSYAAVSLPAGSVGARALKNGAITAPKLNPTSIAASIRAWANLTWAGGTSWRIQASSRQIHVETAQFGEIVSWRHTRFARNCMASVTPQETVGPGGLGGGYVWTRFDAHNALLDIHGMSANGSSQPENVTVLIVCPSPGSQKVSQ
jgi:hypothetical protein